MRGREHTCRLAMRARCSDQLDRNPIDNIQQNNRLVRKNVPIICRYSLRTFGSVTLDSVPSYLTIRLIYFLKNISYFSNLFYR
jgi:hypothetical protein